MSEWIEYKKQLPPLDTWVLIAGVDSDGDKFLYRDKLVHGRIGILKNGDHIQFMEFENQNYVARYITHWMIAPELPAE